MNGSVYTLRAVFFIHCVHRSVVHICISLLWANFFYTQPTILIPYTGETSTLRPRSSGAFKWEGSCRRGRGKAGDSRERGGTVGGVRRRVRGRRLWKTDERDRERGEREKVRTKEGESSGRGRERSGGCAGGGGRLEGPGEMDRGRDGRDTRGRDGRDRGRDGRDRGRDGRDRGRDRRDRGRDGRDRGRVMEGEGME